MDFVNPINLSRREFPDKKEKRKKYIKKKHGLCYIFKRKISELIQDFKY
jgi:hypothetical protein